MVDPSGEGAGITQDGKQVHSGSGELTPKPQVSPANSVAVGNGDGSSKITVDAKLEARLISIIRREVRDPYGGLPADDVLDRLDRRFPEHNIPERMLLRLESEQDARHAHFERLDATELYVAETARLDAKEDRDLQRSWGRRAERVTVFLVAAGIGLVLLGHEVAGSIVLGTTLVGVVGSFLSSKIRPGEGVDE